MSADRQPTPDRSLSPLRTKNHQSSLSKSPHPQNHKLGPTFTDAPRATPHELPISHEHFSSNTKEPTGKIHSFVHKINQKKCFISSPHRET